MARRQRCEIAITLRGTPVARTERMRQFAVCIALLIGCIAEDDGRTPSDQDPVAEDPGSPTTTPPSDFASFMACMQFSDFQTADMANAWASSTLSPTNECASCHTDAMYSGDAVAFFSDLKTRTYLQLLFFNFDGAKVVLNELSIPRVGKSDVPYTGHPKFNAQGGMLATRRLYDLTIARLLAGNCP
jgi:hypothetical protein